MEKCIANRMIFLINTKEFYKADLFACAVDIIEYAVPCSGISGEEFETYMRLNNNALLLLHMNDRAHKKYVFPMRPSY